MKYRANATRDGKWWAIEVPEVPGAFSQAADLEDVPAMARDAIALMLDVPESEVEVDTFVVDGDRTLSLETVHSIQRGVKEAHAGNVVRYEPRHWSALLEELGDEDETS